MRGTYLCVLFATLGVGCATQETFGDREMAPYSAVVVFKWLEDDRPESAEVDPLSESDRSSKDDATGAREPAANQASPPLTEATRRRQWIEENRRWIEDQIIAGLEEHKVFSDFLVTDWENMYLLADRAGADLIVVIRIGDLAYWEPDDVRVHPGLAVLSGFLWVGTAVGGLWVQDQVFPTDSDIEVYWRRCRGADRSVPEVEEPETVAELQDFGQREPVYASGEYNLSLWDRAKFWSTPSAYFTNLVVPPSLVPFYDEEEIDRSLVIDALEDVKRDLAQKLRAGSIRSAGSPFLFRLEDPPNGSVVEGSSQSVSFRYRLEPGFGREYFLRALHVELKKEGETRWRSVKEYRDEDIRRINEMIDNGQSILETIGGLGPGLNLVRFRAETELERRWITNTIALNGT